MALCLWGLQPVRFRAQFSEEDRELILAEVCGRLAKGEPLAAICESEEMPAAITVLEWAQQAPETHGLAIARARASGFDAIACDALRIVDGDKPTNLPGPADASRDKARAEIRLKLLAKWDPKRYGDAFQLKHADADGEKLDTAPLVSELMSLLRGKAAAD